MLRSGRQCELHFELSYLPGTKGIKEGSEEQASSSRLYCSKILDFFFVCFFLSGVFEHLYSLSNKNQDLHNLVAFKFALLKLKTKYYCLHTATRIYLCNLLVQNSFLLFLLFSLPQFPRSLLYQILPKNAFHLGSLSALTHQAVQVLVYFCY